MDCKDATGSTEPSKLALSCAVDWLGQADRTNPAAPDTIGVAIDVPDCMMYEKSARVEAISVPGAPRCTLVAPKFEEKLSASLLSVEATEIIFAALKLEG